MIITVRSKFDVNICINELSKIAVGNCTIGTFNRTKLVTDIRASMTQLETMTFK